MIATSSLFSQLLQFFPRSNFRRLVEKHRAERASKGFSSWDQFVAMLFCHLARANSLREICGGLATSHGRLSHLGMTDAPNKSTLSYANQHRPWTLFQDLYFQTLERFRREGQFGPRKHGFRFKNKLVSFDSSLISLCLKLFPWAKYRTAKGGVKIHVLLDHADYLPSFIHISEGRMADVRAARLLQPKAGTIVVMDRGYNDFELFGRWGDWGVFFVTRLKEHTRHYVIETRAVPPNSPILSDEVIVLEGVDAEAKCTHPLRVIRMWDEEHQRELTFLTNHLDFAARTIADIYKERWQIELFFKAIKQNLRIKTFVGTSENALRIQIWTAVIAILLLKWMHYQSKAGWSLSNMAALTRINLLSYRDLTQWLRDPFGERDNPWPLVQGDLFAPNLGQLPVRR